ncbi:AAA family ATPase [Nostoc sp.]|uniref:AAA family ATPase n=1 Tax=Nostoc sp. TaxID=1180 RepID=UPI002FF83621
MINSLRLINFKRFNNQFFEFRPLTLISGLNSTGKSSVLQSLLLLRQSYQQGLLPKTGLALNGDLVNIGTAQDALYESAKDNHISFEIISEKYEGIWDFNYNPEKKQEDVINVISEPNDSEIYKSNIFSKYFHYLQAERIGPRSFNEMSDYQVTRLRQIGTRGEYTAHFLYIYGREPIPISNLSYPQAKSMDLIDQVEAWMREVSPGIRLKIEANSEMGLVTIKYFYGDGNLYRATNVGFGITYTLSIIVAILSSPPGTLILVENPEAHLHPRGQAKMGELLALAASCDIQLVIETHSDHVLNGIRLAVHGGIIPPHYVQLHYFQQQEKQGQALTEVISPRINRSGRIDKWPDGFFDEWDKSLEVLLEPVGE